MNNGFSKGIILGGVIGASVSLIMNSDMILDKTKKKLSKNGKSMLRKTGRLVNDLTDMFD